MTKVALNNNAEFDVVSCGSVGDALYIVVCNSNFTELALNFSDENATSKIRYLSDSGELVEEFVGFTNLFEIMTSGQNIRVTMKTEPEEFQRFVSYQE